MQRALVTSEPDRQVSSFFTNRVVAGADQFDAWQEFNADIIELSPTQKHVAGFAVDHWSWTIGDVVLERTALPDRVGRQWHHRTRSHLDHWCIVLARGGDEAAVGAAPSLGVRSLTRPFHGRGNDTEVIALYVPRARLAKHAGALESPPAVDLSPGCQALLSAHLDNLVHQIDNLPHESWALIADATCALVTACLVHTPDHAAEAERPIFSALRERSRRIVQANMASPDFGPAALTRLLFVSRSKLYRIFEPDGGVARFIQRERLAEAYRRLTRDTAPVSISALSLEVGFRDHSAFSRSFRTEYGVSPREARETALANCLVGGLGGASAALGNLAAPDPSSGREHPGGCAERLSVRGESWKDLR